MRYAIVDIGSNTVKMHIFDVSGRDFSKIHSLIVHAKLIKYIENGQMTEDGIKTLCNVINRFTHEANRLGCDIFKCFATASLRRAENRGYVINRVKAETGNEIDLISGEREAELSFAGATHSLDIENKCGMLLDMGGGSTEAVCFSGRDITDKYSMPFGALSLYSDFVKETLPTNEEADKISSYAKSHIKGNEKSNEIYIVGGTGEALRKIHGALKGESNDGIYSISYKDLKNTLENIIGSETAELFLKKVTPNRLTTVLPGGFALLALAHAYGAQKLTFLTEGIREGYLLSII